MKRGCAGSLLIGCAIAGCASPTPEPAAPAPVSAPILEVDGEQVFRKCYGCHSVEPGEAAQNGPNLHGIVGRRIASQPDFDYSPAMEAFARREEVWTAELLARFVADPEALVPGTDMFVPPVTDPEERAALIDFLKAHRGN